MKLTHNITTLAVGASAALLIGLTGNTNAASIVYEFATDGTVTTNDFSGDLITVSDVVITGLHPAYNSFDGYYLRNDPAILTVTISIPDTVVLDLTSLTFMGGIDVRVLRNWRGDLG